ncbi:hypothetical protein HAX54_051125 [Datura stramonium]|uniref:DUF4283 domain-containing protein n=1 Tax=Datura stramonium TaxID=4076 RepID=A0ABS8SY07_DATST|nr:hypothetical protein [Datura stramonium]
MSPIPPLLPLDLSLRTSSLHATDPSRGKRNETMITKDLLNGTVIDEVMVPPPNPEPVHTEDKGKQLPPRNKLFKHNRFSKNNMTISYIPPPPRLLMVRWLVILKPWTPDFDFNKEYPTEIPLWVNVTKTLPEEVVIMDPNGQQFLQPIVFDWKLEFCQQCQIVGHKCPPP